MELFESGKRETIKRYSYAVVFTVIIYLTIPFARPVSNYLIEHNLFTCSVYLIIALFIILCVIPVIRYTGFSIINLIVIAVFFILYFSIVESYDVLAEKIHFVEYGILAFLILYAVKTHIKTFLAYPVSFAAVFFIGWGDEIIQHFIPERYYDFNDVILNAISGGLVLILIIIADKLKAVNSGRDSM